MPDWRIPPPRRLRISQARGRSSRRKARQEPTGQPSPFDRLTMPVVAPAVRVAGGTPSAAAAFHRRAPSRCTGNPAECAAVTMSAVTASGITLPPAALWVFSIATAEMRGTWGDAGELVMHQVGIGFEHQLRSRRRAEGDGGLVRLGARGEEQCVLGAEQCR